MRKITSNRQRVSIKRGLIPTFLAAVIISVTGLLAPMSAAQAKNTFVFANASPYDTMDPQVVFDVGRVAYRLNLYDGLMRWLDNPPKLNPWLAESYDISSDGKQYTFTLRANAKFHDGSLPVPFPIWFEYTLEEHPIVDRYIQVALQWHLAI